MVSLALGQFGSSKASLVLTLALLFLLTTTVSIASAAPPPASLRAEYISYESATKCEKECRRDCNTKASKLPGNVKEADCAHSKSCTCWIEKKS